MTREEYIEFANALKNNYTIDFDKLPEFCDMAISALSENKGAWIKTKDQYETYHFTCSKCGNDIATKSDAWNDNFCSECGADMRGE